jgi:tetratricopeptide (TPR) repeat protein
MSAEALEKIFVQRHDLAAHVVERIQDSALTASKHHVLLVGPRGIGKTHLVSLIHNRVEAVQSQRDRLWIAWLCEDETTSSFLDFLLRMLKALAHDYPSEFPHDRLSSVYGIKAKDAEAECVALLQEYVGERTLLVVVENLDGVFGGLGDEGQKRFRALLQQHPCFTILATSQSLFNGVSSRSSPFFGFFEIEHLGELDVGESVELLGKIAEFREDAELAAFLRTPIGRARVRAIHHLAGGNHRIYVVLSQFLKRESLDELTEAFLQMLDDLTPYYQARLSWLSPQQRKIVEYLCDRRGAVPVKEIAQGLFITHQTVSGQLKDLREKGYVRSTNVGRESFYELREPLMRLCMEIKKNRGGPIRLFLDFLRLWYTPNELRALLEMLPESAQLERNYLREAILSLETDSKDPRIDICRREFREMIANNELEKALGIAEELVALDSSKESPWVEYAMTLWALGRREQSFECAQEALRINASSGGAHWLLGELHLESGHPEPAMLEFDLTIQHGFDNDLACHSRGLALQKLNRTHEALEVFDDGLKRWPNAARLWWSRAEVLDELQVSNEAHRCREAALELEPENGRWQFLHGMSCIIAFDVVRARECLVKADLYCPDTPFLNVLRGFVLQLENRCEEAIEAFDRASNSGVNEEALDYVRVAALLQLSRFAEAIGFSLCAFERFSGEDGPRHRFFKAILRSLIDSKNDAVEWDQSIHQLVKGCERIEGGLSILATELVDTLGQLTTTAMSQASRIDWREVWHAAASNHDEFESPLRLLDATVEFVESHDERVLLALPTEERKILESLLSEDEADAVWDETSAVLSFRPAERCE